MKLYQKVLRLLWNITFIAGFSYIGISILKVIQEDSELADSLQMILALPMIVGEVGLALWLIIKGGKKATAKLESQ